MQLTIKECDAQIAHIQKKIPELQSQHQQLIGYRQALIEMEENKDADQPEEQAEEQAE